MQGVGFRPFAHNLAVSLGLTGCVGNNTKGAFIEIEGAPAQLERFARRLVQELPLPGQIQSLEVFELQAVGDTTFEILESEHSGTTRLAVTPDTATCPDCLAELGDPGDRRYRYPFLNCTRCGPRYSIIREVPYDRAATTMAEFTMCPDCRAEYEDPADRRFHAQPNACPVCGPRAWCCDPAGQTIEGEAVAVAAEALRHGDIVAVKGLGGFHLACRADDSTAVTRLRERKGREARPFAVMVRDLEAARALALTDLAIEAALISPARPIVLMPRRPYPTVAAEVAPGCRDLGLLLPYTPLHTLLLQYLDLPLVMTSANPSAEPICCDNAEALARLGGMADLFLMHDRRIERPIDDSVVVTAVDGERENHRLVPLRRARGFVPGAITLPQAVPMPVLALGGEMKSAICLAEGDQAMLSEHLGELDNPAAFRNFLRAIERLQQLTGVRPRAVACDLHPSYAATRWAPHLGLPVIPVQHHHAHIASAQAEHGLEGPVIGVAADGAGYGSDGTIWGAEVLICDGGSFKRAAHLKPFALLGGDRAARETWRPALGLLASIDRLPDPGRAEALFPTAEPQSLALALNRLAASRGGVPTSSLGRLFDAAAALLGLCPRNRYESEAATILQSAAEGVAATVPLGFSLVAPETASTLR